MPDLEAKIAAWRARLSIALRNEEVVRELEMHLRDHVETRTRSGVEEDKAFEEAVQRIGEPRMIAREFHWVQSRWLPKSRPAIVVLLLFVTLLALITSLLAAKYSAGTMTLLLATHVFATVTAYLSVFATAAIALCSWVVGLRRALAPRERRDLQQLIFRLTVIGSVCLPIGLALGMFWASANLGRAWDWDPKETGAAFVLFSNLLLLLVQLWKVDDRLRYLLATLGAAILAIGWFGASAATSTVPIAWLCGAFTAAQLAMLVLRSSASRTPAAE